MIAKENVALGKSSDELKPALNIRRFLEPYSPDRMAECFHIASVLRRDRALLVPTFKCYSALYDEQESKRERILLNARLGVLLDLYRCIGEGIFLKSKPVVERENAMDKEIERLEKMHEAAPEYVLLPLKIIKNKKEKAIGYTLKLINDSETLEGYLSSRTPLPDWVEDKIIDFIKKIHFNGIVHGDVFESNFIIDEKNGRLFAIDPDGDWRGTAKNKLAEKCHVYEMIQYIRECREELAAFPDGNHPKSFTLNLRKWKVYAKEKGISTWESDWLAYQKAIKKKARENKAKA